MSAADGTPNEGNPQLVKVRWFSKTIERYMMGDIETDFSMQTFGNSISAAEPSKLSVTTSLRASPAKRRSRST